MGGWVSGFTRLESLLLCSYDCGLKVSASLASLTRLSSLTLMARTREHALIQTAEVGRAGRSGLLVRGRACAFHPSHSPLPAFVPL